MSQSERRIGLNVNPTPWAEMKGILLQDTRPSFNDFPSRFTMSKTLSSVFDEMLPPGNIISDYWKKINIAVGRDIIGNEVGRSLYIENQELKVEISSRGKSQRTGIGIQLLMDSRANERGNIHTHPIDRMPSSNDILLLLVKKDVCQFIVTPTRVIALFRTLQTPLFDVREIGVGYIMGMGKQKGKLHYDYTVQTNIDSLFSMTEPTPNQDEAGWTLGYDDLKELSIGMYEAPRNNSIFIRKNEFGKNVI